MHHDEEADRPAGSLGIGHEGMSMLSTEDGDNCSVAPPLCDVEGCCARGYPSHSRAVFMSLSLSASSSTQVAWPFSAACMGRSIPAIPHAPSCSTSSPTASACPQMTSSPPVASPAPLYSGDRASEWLARSGRPGGVSTECWGLPSAQQRRVGQLLGLSISSPLAERVPGRTASAGPILPTALIAVAAPPWSGCKERAAAFLLAGRP